jgi:hypothetical protein
VRTLQIIVREDLVALGTYNNNTIKVETRKTDVDG